MVVRLPHFAAATTHGDNSENRTAPSGCHVANKTSTNVPRGTPAPVHSRFAFRCADVRFSRKLSGARRQRVPGLSPVHYKGSIRMQIGLWARHAARRLTRRRKAQAGARRRISCTHRNEPRSKPTDRGRLDCPLPACERSCDPPRPRKHRRINSPGNDGRTDRFRCLNSGKNSIYRIVLTPATGSAEPEQTKRRRPHTKVDAVLTLVPVTRSRPSSRYRRTRRPMPACRAAPDTSRHTPAQ